MTPFVTLDPTAVPSDTSYTHYCAHCGLQLREMRATENRAPHRCEQEIGEGFFGVAFGEELRPVRWAADLVELPPDEDDDLPGSICAGGL